MATRSALRFVSRRFSTGGKILSEEEKAAENVYIKKVEQEKLEKLARKGPNAGEQQAAAGAGAAATGAKASGAGESAPKVSEDKSRNYAVLAGVVTVIGAVGWYMKSGGKKQQETQD